MIAMNMLQMAVVKIIDVTVVLHSHMTACRAMSVSVTFLSGGSLIHIVYPFLQNAARQMPVSAFGIYKIPPHGSPGRLQLHGG